MNRIAPVLIAALLAAPLALASEREGEGYVGARACGESHIAELERWTGGGDSHDDVTLVLARAR